MKSTPEQRPQTNIHSDTSPSNQLITNISQMLSLLDTYPHYTKLTMRCLYIKRLLYEEYISKTFFTEKGLQCSNSFAVIKK